jgi:carbonic anhydrase
LGALQEKYQIWGEAWRMHLGLALQLHKVTEVICIDHDKCGAYKLFFPEMKPEEEKKYHVEHLKKFRESLKQSHPDLKVLLFFMNLDGSCEDYTDEL